jgi:aquaporin Z
MRAWACEAFGAYCLVFAGTGAIIVNDQLGGAVTHVGIALTFGLIVLAMIYTVGGVSGAHLNPAVTIGFWAAGRFNPERIAPYIAAQCGGAILASLSLRAMFPLHSTLGATQPNGGLMQSWFMELILTWILMVVILGVSIGGKEKGVLAGVAVGSVIALEATFAGPVSGASMNPARSLAPAAISGHWGHLWIYLTAPTVGALAGVATSKLLHGGIATEVSR